MTEGSATLEERPGKAERKPLLRALARDTLGIPPVWLMRQAGRYLPEYRALRARAGGFLELCLTPELAAEATLQPVRRFNLDAAILFSDILMIPMALGQKLRFSESEGPLLEPLGGNGQTVLHGLERLHEPLAPVYEAIERVKSALEPECALIGFAGAPWTVASYMIEGRTSRDFAAVKLFAFTRPGEFAHLIALLVEASAGYLIRQVAAGAEVLQLFDSWAGALGASEFDAWCIEPIRRIVTEVKAIYPRHPDHRLSARCGTRLQALRRADRGGRHQPRSRCPARLGCARAPGASGAPGQLGPGKAREWWRRDARSHRAHPCELG